ncbi:PAS domain-containing protein [Ahrensia sp. R2A130]|uniref:PAS domain-containing protein n=1 Tax=Ahrensia sp. R2A130 TaxID=744979 RepID=UPI0001E0A490|nr:PAS domain-containing protein [Ahrensia sp. R2A130]EFL88623.1 sensory box histidine kinase [Ahrensia sp. R2A130]
MSASKVLLSSALACTISDPNLPDSPLVFVNRAFEKTTGYMASYAIGKNCRFLQGEGTSPEHVTLIREGIRHQRDVEVVLKNYRANGRSFWNQLSLSPIFDDDGKLTYYIGVQQEVPAPEGRTEDSVSIDVKLQEMQHRVKNHLAMLVSLIRMQSRKKEHDPLKDYESLARRVESLALLYDQVHARSKDDDQVELGEYLERIVHSIQSFSSPDNVQITLKADDITAPLERGVQLGLIVTEIVTNALKHAFPDQQDGLISIAMRQLPDHKIEVSVGDNGVGFDVDQADTKPDSFGNKIIKSMLASSDGEAKTLSSEFGTVVEITVPS